MSIVKIEFLSQKTDVLRLNLNLSLNLNLALLVLEPFVPL
jgi:hypothetical protein